MNDVENVTLENWKAKENSKMLQMFFSLSIWCQWSNYSSVPCCVMHSLLLSSLQINPLFSIYPSVGSFYLLVKPKIIYFLFCSNSCRDRRVRISTSMIQWFGLQKSNLLYQPIFRGYTRVDCKLIGLMEFHLKFFKLWMNIKIHGVIVTFLKSCKHFFNCNFDILITNQTYKISDRLSTMAEVRQKRTIPLKKPLRLNVSVIVNQAMILPKIIYDRFDINGTIPTDARNLSFKKQYI